jgi:hypothetical protein
MMYKMFIRTKKDNTNMEQNILFLPWKGKMKLSRLTAMPFEFLSSETALM